MAIRTGIGVGEAQVYDTSGIVNTYFKLMQKQQQDQAKYESQLADIITKADTSGLDPRDSKYVLEKYNGVKDAYNKLASIRNPTEQRLAMSELKKSVSSINEYANNAKLWRKNILDLANNVDKNRDDYEDGVLDELKKLVDGSYNDAIVAGRAVISPFDFKRAVDYSLVPKSLDGIRKDIEGAAKDSRSYVVGASRVPGYRSVTYKATPESFDNSFKLNVLTDKNQRYQYKQLYKNANPEATEPTVDDLTKFARSLYEEKYGPAAYSFAGEDKKMDSPKSDKQSVSELWGTALNGLFDQNMDTQKIISMLKAQGKGKIYDIVPNGTGYDVIPMMTKVGSQKLLTPKPGKPIFVQDSYTLAQTLGSLGVGSAGFGSVTKLSAPPSSENQNNAKVLEGTTKQLQDAAAKMGMKKEAYKKYLISQGYKVIER